MNYSAKKIYVTCGWKEVHEWAAYMQSHMDEVRQSLSQEQVRHEAWYAGQDDGGLYVIGVMDVDDQEASASIAASSSLTIDQVHRQFKGHWDRSRIRDLQIAPGYPPSFKDCKLVLDARPRSL
jgi:hypothetical protein